MTKDVEEYLDKAMSLEKWSEADMKPEEVQRMILLELDEIRRQLRDGVSLPKKLILKTKG